MSNSILFMIFLQIFLILLNAIFACAEISIISMNDNKLEKMASEGDKRAIRLSKLTSEPARFLATIQVAITLSGFLGSAFAAENFSDVLVQTLVKLGVPVPAATLDAIAVVLITIILSYFTLVFGELVPKQIGMRKSEPLALGMSGLICTISKIFSPIVWFLTASTNGILRLLEIDPNAEDDSISEEEIRMMVDVGSKKGTIDHEEKEFIQNVFEFDDLYAGEIATHRTDVTLLYLDESMEQWIDVIHNSRHTLYPVCNDSADNIIGILNTKTYFRLEDQSRESVMENAVFPAYFVPETVKADVLFKNMKRNHKNLAIVLDEYGGMSGIVTINDLVEQLVGDLGDDDFIEVKEPLIESIGENAWKIHGDAPLEEVSEKLGIKLISEDYGTFNGLIFDALGTIPQDGTNVEVETHGLLIRTTEIRNHQVKTCLVYKQTQ